MTPVMVQTLRKYIREFEDRKITSAVLSRQIFHAAREVDGLAEAPLRRALEMLGNRIMALAEERIAGPSPAALKIVDEVESHLVDWGY